MRPAGHTTSSLHLLETLAGKPAQAPPARTHLLESTTAAPFRRNRQLLIAVPLLLLALKPREVLSCSTTSATFPGDA